MSATHLQVNHDASIIEGKTNIISSKMGDKENIIRGLIRSCHWNIDDISHQGGSFFKVKCHLQNEQYNLNIFISSIRDEDRANDEFKMQIGTSYIPTKEEGWLNIVLGVYIKEETDLVSEMLFATYYPSRYNFETNPSLRGVRTVFLQRAKIHGFVKTENCCIFRAEFFMYYVKNMSYFNDEVPYLDNSTEEPNSTSKLLGKQIIYYGAPGTGKSYNIDKELKDKNVPETQVKRVIFYPDYTYSDFIGGLSPITNAAGKPEYRFIAGPFSEILKDAFDNTDMPYYVVIEEINRGNPAAIFGDVFQLLDRDSAGKSKYTITNSDVASYLRGEDESKFANDRIWLPSNLNIVCTMNTADQNVFVLDTAFKRRFAMEYVPIDFNKLNAEEVKAYNDETEVFEGQKTIKEVFQNTDLGGYVTAHEGSIKRNWPTFAQLVNEKINLINRSGDSISEDKKLGPFFVTLDEIQDRQKFADKVLYYLKQDVFKYTDTVLVPSYQKLYSDFVNGGADLFELFASVE